MLLSSLVLASALVAAQEPAPMTAPPPQEPATMSDAGASQSSIDAGLAAFKKRRFSKAEAEFQKAVASDPSSAAANFYLGYTYYKIAEPSRRNTPTKQKALEYFDKAFQLDPSFTPVWQSRK